MEIAYIVGGLVAVLIVYFLFFRKSEEAEQLEERAPKKLEPPPATKAKPAAAAQPSADEDAEVPVGEAPDAPRSPATAAAPEPSEPPAPPKADLQGLRKGLAKSRGDEGFFGRLRALIGGKKEIDESIAEEIEEILLTSDVGVNTTQAILERIREQLGRGELSDADKVWSALHAEAVRILSVEGRAGGLHPKHKPTVVLMIGVNGAGKTTTIGKLATQLTAQGKTCVLAAGDTFRAAAVQQLEVWGERVGCKVVKGKEGADPGSVVFDAVKQAQESGADVVLADTAGRLHTKTNLMTQMTKIAKTAGKALDGAPHETLLVIDATNGQNAMAQAKEFKEALDITGIVLTKLDGTAKGGMVLGICDALAIPVRFIGLGERPDDLHVFSPESFSEALLGRETQ